MSYKPGPGLTPVAHPLSQGQGFIHLVVCRSSMGIVVTGSGHPRNLRASFQSKGPAASGTWEAGLTSVSKYS